MEENKSIEFDPTGLKSIEELQEDLKNRIAENEQEQEVLSEKKEERETAEQIQDDPRNEEKWGFKGFNVHWGNVRNYTWQEVVGYLHLVYPEEFEILTTIPYAKIVNK